MQKSSKNLPRDKKSHGTISKLDLIKIKKFRETHWTCPYQTGHLACLTNLLAMNSRGERMRKPECGWMLL